MKPINKASQLSTSQKTAAAGSETGVRKPVKTEATGGTPKELLSEKTLEFDQFNLAPKGLIQALNGNVGSTPHVMVPPSPDGLRWDFQVNAGRYELAPEQLQRPASKLSPEQLTRFATIHLPTLSHQELTTICMGQAELLKVPSNIAQALVEVHRASPDATVRQILEVLTSVSAGIESKRSTPAEAFVEAVEKHYGPELVAQAKALTA